MEHYVQIYTIYINFYIQLILPIIPYTNTCTMLFYSKLYSIFNTTICLYNMLHVLKFSNIYYAISFKDNVPTC